MKKVKILKLSPDSRYLQKLALKTSVRGGTIKGAQQKLRFLQFLQKLRKIGEIAVFAEINLGKWKFSSPSGSRLVPSRYLSVFLG